MSEWEVWLADPYGNRLALADGLISGAAAKVANDVGAFTLVLPEEYDQYIRLDGIIEVWRRPEGGALRLFNAYLLRRWRYLDDEGRDLTEWGGPDANHLLTRRIVAYAAGSTAAEASAEAGDNLLKRVVRLNCSTAATDADRDWSSLGVTIAADADTDHNAAAISLAFSRRKLYDLFRDVADSSRTSGTNLYYEFAPVPADNGTMGFEFRTHIDQPGIDRTGIDQVTFGREWGNLANTSIENDYTDEVTVEYVGGRGVEDDRVVEEVEDTTRSGASPWGRIEDFYNAAGQMSTTAEYVAAGNAQLSEKRPRLKVTGEIIDTEQARFGVDWNWGDRVMLTYRGHQYEAVITAVTITMRGGSETIRAIFEVQ